MITSMISVILAFMLLIGGNPCYIKSPPEITESTIKNTTDFEIERNIFLDHVDNITRIDETKNDETIQITTEILLEDFIFKSLFLDYPLYL